MAFAAFRNRFIAFAASASLCAGSVTAAPAALPAAIDQARIHAYYTDGEFGKVIKDLEAFSKSRRSCTHAESVFVEKHLSVVYAAHPGTRELGRYHMYRLLDLAPGSDLLDMFVGEEVGGVFEKVGKEYALRNPSKAAIVKTASGVAKPAPALARSAPVSAFRSAPTAAPAAASGVSHASNAKARPAPAAISTANANTANIANAPTPADNRIPARINARPARDIATRTKPLRPASGTVSRESAAAPKDPGARPAWKEPGLWIGGGAAFAVVAFTLFYSGSEDAPAGKTYVVPATAAR